MDFKRALRKGAELGVVFTVITTLLLVGCGGGGSSSSTAATPPVFTIATPTASAGTPVDAGTAGTLPFLAYTFAATSFQDVAIAGAGTTSVMTFTNPVFTLTGATSGAPVWSANDGLVNANGNVVSYCSAGSQTTNNGVQTVNMPLMDGHRIFLSANLTAVSNFAEMKNVSLTKFDCAGSTGNLAFNAAGDGLTKVDANGTSILSSADIAQLTSVDGTTNSDGSNNKARAYKYTNNGVTTYFIVVIAKYSGGANSGGHVALFTADFTVTAAPSAADVNSLLSDQQANFTGGWWFTAAPTANIATGDNLGSAVAAASGVVDAYENTVTQNSPNNYTQTYAEKRLVTTVWGANTSSLTYALPQSGSWIPIPLTAAIVNNQNGTYTYTPTGLTADTVGVTRTDLAGTQIVCTDANYATITCPVPGNYPVGASSYWSSYTAAANEFALYGSYLGASPAISVPVSPVTNANGVTLTALPAVGTTFCDPYFLYVYQAISPTPAAGLDNYNLYSTASCTQPDITAALGTTALGNVIVSVQATGNSTVKSVIRIESTAGLISWMIYGVRAGAVYPGYMIPMGVANSYAMQDLNKTAINAELVANGLTPLP